MDTGDTLDMVNPTSWLATLDTAVFVISTIIYARVAQLVLRRRASPDAQLARNAFATWWISLAIVTVISLFYRIGGLFLPPDLAFSVALLNTLLIVIVVAIWGLAYYLVFLYTGNSRWLLPVSAAYGLIGFALMWAVAWRDPVAVTTTATGTKILFANELTGWPALALSLVFSVPIVAAALAYGTLFFKTDDPEARYRIRLVALAFIGWFGWSILGAILDSTQVIDNTTYAWQWAGRVVSIIASIAVLAAYQPPARVRERWALPT